MKKFVLILLALCLVSSLIACSGGDDEKSVPETVSETAAESSEDVEVSVVTEVSVEEKIIIEEAKNVMNVYNVRDYGAKANGSDDSAAIQAAIDAAAQKGGTVYIPAGTYGLAHSVEKKAGVSIVGDGMWTSRLKWIGKGDEAMIVMANEALWGTTVENLYFTANLTNDKVTGIRGGSTLQAYNSAIGTFKNLVFSGLYCGICGDAEPAGVGIFDCMFENVFCSSCTYGLHLYGSGNTIIHPRIATCRYGLTLDFLNGESFDGVHVIGGIFASNTTDIYVPNVSGTRPCNFVGTWFENATQGILTIVKPGTRIMNLTFRDCMLNSAADNKNYYLFDARNAAGVVTLDSCTVINDAGIKAPTISGGRLAITNLQTYDNSGTYVINDRNHNNSKVSIKADTTEVTILHGLRFVPNGVFVTPKNELAAKLRYYVTVDEKNIIIHIVEAPETGYAEFYWEVTR